MCVGGGHRLAVSCIDFLTLFEIGCAVFPHSSESAGIGVTQIRQLQLCFHQETYSSIRPCACVLTLWVGRSREGDHGLCHTGAHGKDEREHGADCRSCAQVMVFRRVPTLSTAAREGAMYEV